jgi:murein DD-endopeptidase MepM/ murein hydrolase activator NlpD
MEIIETTLQVNRFARKTRHLKIFSKSTLLKLHFYDVLKYISKPFGVLSKMPFAVQIRRFLISVKLLVSEFIPVTPSKRLLFQAGLVAGTALLMTSFTTGGSFTAASMSYSSEYISAYSLPGEILVADEEGYLIKINPQTDDSNRIGLTDYAVHTIEDGESLSLIAGRYGVGVETIMWENNISNANSIRAGQKLLVPPVDGLSYTVSSGDTLEGLAEKYEITSEAIIAQNALESETINKGQDLFLPGAEAITPVVTVAGDYTVSSSTRSVSYATAAASTSAPVVGRIFIYPTTGKITNGYYAGHYAIDISDTSMPAVWAAGGGTITKVSTGTWGGGYGNHVIIDHGDGLQTLYAHLDSANVYEGQWVGQGDVIGIMGNTGRVYGVTGIHLHWEVIQDGVKQYPGNYY